MDWDCSIDLVSAHLEPGSAAPGDAVERVRAAVERLPGAGWISVAWCGPLPASRWLRVYPRGMSMEPEGDEWTAIRDRVAATVSRVLA
jgi:hypothetical protein